MFGYKRAKKKKKSVLDEPTPYSSALGPAVVQGSGFPHRQQRAGEGVFPPTSCSERQPSNCFPLWPAGTRGGCEVAPMDEGPAWRSASGSRATRGIAGRVASTCTCRKPRLRESPAGGGRLLPVGVGSTATCWPRGELRLPGPCAPSVPGGGRVLPSERTCTFPGESEPPGARSSQGVLLSSALGCSTLL